MPRDEVDAWLEEFYAQWYPFAPRSKAFIRTWTRLVRSLDVRIYPSGRAEIRHVAREPFFDTIPPSVEPSDLAKALGGTYAVGSEAVTLERPHVPPGRRRLSPDVATALEAMEHLGPQYTVELRWEMRKRQPAVTEVHIDSREHVLWGAFDLAAYVAALYLALRAREQPSAGEEPPQPGKPANTGFYRNVIAEYEQLLREAHPNPVQELARRRSQLWGRKVPPGTVKSWLSRGRQYLREE